VSARVTDPLSIENILPTRVTHPLSVERGHPLRSGRPASQPFSTVFARDRSGGGGKMSTYASASSP
jgi:hypothetical protein